MNNPMHEWLLLGLSFAGAPALALVGRWEEVEAGETLPRAARAPRPAPEPSPASEPVHGAEPVLAPVPGFLRLYRVSDEMMDADRRAYRRAGMVRAGY